MKKKLSLCILILFPLLSICAGELHQRALQFEEKIRKHHLLEGQLRGAVFKKDGTIRYYNGGNGLLWTGTHLASLSLHYKVEPNEKTLHDIRTVLKAMHTLAHISGTPGVLVREFYPGPPQNPDRHRRAHSPYEKYSYHARQNRDQTTGYLWGLLNCYLYVDQPEIKTQCRELIALTVEQFYTKKTPWGRTNRIHWNLKQPILKNNYASSHSLRLNAAAMGHFIAKKNIFEYEYRRLSLPIHQHFNRLISAPIMHKHVEYYSLHLNTIRYAGLLLLDTKSKRRAYFQKELLRLFEVTHHHKNAYFLYLTLSSLDDEELKKLYTKYPIEKYLKEAKGSIRQITEHKLRQGFPEDISKIKRSIPPYYYFLKYGKVLVKGSSKPRPQSLYPLEMKDRLPTFFQWQRNPYGLPYDEKEKGNPQQRQPGIDYTIAYWLGRLHGFIDKDE